MKFNLLVENTRMNRAVTAYRRFANIKEDVVVTADNLDEWALNEAACKYSVQKNDLRHIVLGEDVTLDAAARALEAQTEEANSKTEIELALDRKLAIARRMHRRGSRNGYPAVLLEGDGGVGKTSIVNQWAKNNGVNFFNYDLRTASIESFQGVIANHPEEQEFVIRKISKELLIPLGRPDTVMFIDEYNRGKPAVRNALLDLIINHKMAVPMVGDYEESKKVYAPYGELEENGYLYFPNLLFVVAAQNPNQSNYAGTQELDAAEIDRLEVMKIQANNDAVLRFLTSKFTKDMESDKEYGDAEGVRENQGRIEIAKALLSSPDFYFDTGEERSELFDENSSNKYLSPRSLEYLLINSDGTKDNVLKLWNNFCNYKKKTIAENILKDYKDVDDKANDAISQESSSDVFSKREAPSARLRKLLNNDN